MRQFVDLIRMRWMRWFTLLLVMVTFSLGGAETQKKLAICAIFQDEAPYLKEWIEYHLLVGVEHFYLYNNDSQDGYRKVLRPYVEKGVVTLTQWPSATKGGNWLPDQKRAYNHCIRWCRDKVEWLAIIDVDEFMVPVDKDTVTEYLAEFDAKPHVGAIKMNWQLFGTSGWATLPSDRLMIEAFTRKAVWDYASTETPNNTVVKSIVRPTAVGHYRIHEGDYYRPFFAYPKGGRDRFQPVNIERIQLNHYWTKADDFFYEVKIDRRLRFLGPGYKQEMLKKLEELNQADDTLILKYAARLRERMQN